MATAKGDQIQVARAIGRPAVNEFGKGVVRFFKRQPLGTVAIFILLCIVAVAVFAPLVSTHDPYAFDRGARLTGPSSKHWFGADSFGRDTYTRVVFGARLAIIVSFSAVALGTGIGSFIGLTSGYWGGKYDLVIQRFIDTLIALPGLVVALVMVAVMGRSLINVILAVGLLSIPGVARLTRAITMGVIGSEYVEAARAFGASTPRIILRHVLPQVAPLMIIAASAGLGGAILAEASLSFLGLGPAPPTPTWGSMLSGQAIQFVDESPWSVVFPGVALTLTVLSVNLWGDAMRDVLDPRLRK